MSILPMTPLTPPDVKNNVIALLYSLMADHMPYNDVSQILRQILGPVDEKVYFNEHLLEAAKDLYRRYIEK